MSENEMMPCEEVLARLWEYIDGELTPERTARIREHLDMCERCYPEYDFRRAFRVFLRRQVKTPAPPGLRRKVFEQLLQEEAKSA